MAFTLSLAGGVMLAATILEFWVPAAIGDGSLLQVVGFSLLGALAFVLLSALIPEPAMAGESPSPTPTPQKQRRRHADDITANGRTTTESCVQRKEPGIPGSPPCGTVSTEMPAGFADDMDVEDATLQGVDGDGLGDIEKALGPLKVGSPKARHEDTRRWRLAMVLMLTLSLHNFPEGFAVAVSALESRRLGVVVMIAIAVHNVPEGIAISVPVLAASGSLRKALWMTFLSGMAEPLGAAVALIVMSITGALDKAALDHLLCTVGGVMFAVSAKELLPEAWRQKR